jgi:hypothetical protein
MEFAMPAMEALFPDGANVDKALLRSWLLSHVDTVAALRALPLPPASGRTIQLDGYYANGDGGGGQFRWDAANTGADNAGTVIKPTAAGAAGRWLREFSGDLDVRWFGARGDVTINGSGIAVGTDDTAAFNLATAAVVSHTGNGDPAIPRRIRVPAGRWRVDGPVYIRKGQHLAGDGVGATRIYPVGQSLVAGRWLVFVLSKGPANGSDAQSQIGIAEDAGGLPAVLSDLILYNTVNPPTGPGPTGVFCETEGYSVHNVWSTSMDIGFDLGGGHGVISNLQADVGRIGFRLSGHNHNLTNISCFNNYVGIEFVPVDNPYHHGTSEVKITNLNVFAPKQTGVYFWPHPTFRYQNIIVADSQFSNAHPDWKPVSPSYLVQGADGFVMSAATQAHNIVLDNCTFANNRNHAIRLVPDAAVVPPSHYIVRNCVFEGQKSFWADDHMDAPQSSAVLAQNCRLELSNCTLKNLKPAAYNWDTDRYYVAPQPPAAPMYTGAISLKGAISFLMKGCRVLQFSNVASASWALVDMRSMNGAGSEVVFDDIDLDGSVPLFGHRAVDTIAVRGCRRWLGPSTTPVGSARVVWKLPYQQSNQWIVTVRVNMNAGGDGNYRKTSSYVVAKQSGLVAGSKVDLLTSVPLLLAGVTSNLPQLAVQFGLNSLSTTSAAMSQTGEVWISVPTPAGTGLPAVTSAECEVQPMI